MYSDAQLEENKPLLVGAVISSLRLPRLLGLTAIIPDKTVSSWVSQETLGGQCELCAPLVALYNVPDGFRDSSQGYLGPPTTHLLFAG